jgi:two-component system phosphate regulon response regulator OmpR
VNSQVLVIDDDVKLGELLTDYLARFDYGVTVATTPDAGLAQLAKQPFNVVILDVMLPGMDGFAVLKRIRQTADVPVIMLTARGDTMDRIVGLELGADDYLPKPFEPRELVARMQTVLRRSQAPLAEKAHHLRAGDLEVDMHTRNATLNGRPLDLTTMEFEILALLIAHSGQVLNRDDIINTIRGIDWDAFNRSIDVTVSRLRTKLNDDPKQPRFIKTVWGRGYQFIGETEKNLG